MKRSRRLEPAGRVIGERERRQAEQLAARERRVLECEAKLAELRGYRDDYAREFAARAARGGGVAALRDYQVFMARLAQAIGQQEQVLAQARDERDGARSQWQDAARHAKAVGTVLDRWRAEERQAEDRRAQRESDERAQRRGPSRRDG